MGVRGKDTLAPGKSGGGAPPLRLAKTCRLRGAHTKVVITNPPLLERNREMATKSINVKVSTAKVVKALETALANRKKQVADWEKAQENHKKQIADWEKSVVEHIKSGKAKVSEVACNSNWRTDTKEARVTVTLPASLMFPEAPDKPAEMWSLNNDIEELENAIALLKMTDEEFVSTSTYKGVARLIK